jgi:hypothetical protein
VLRARRRGARRFAGSVLLVPRLKL